MSAVNWNDVNWVRRYILFHHKQHPVALGKGEGPGA
jgi:hypothetical protein